MATIAIDRPRAHRPGPFGPMQVEAPLGSSQSSKVAGDVLIIEGGATGYLIEGNADPAQVVGILEAATVGTPTAGDLYPMTLILPGHLYEFSNKAATVAQARCWNILVDVNDHAIGGVIDAAAGGSNHIVKIAFIMGAMGTFQINKYIAQAGTSSTGAQTIASNTALGVAGDTSPRLLVSFIASGCELTA